MGCSHTALPSDVSGSTTHVCAWLCCSVEDIFAAIENDPEPSATKYLVRASYLQIYNEVGVTLPCRHAQCCLGWTQCCVHSSAAPPVVRCVPMVSEQDFKSRVLLCCLQSRS